ncbi:MAG: CHASE2 domain-containing protein, partial [Deltaproteobacteria bacterium]|nr:CHASE2 domain-containing protein [Deltaproteobacteria bacterium]
MNAFRKRPHLVVGLLVSFLFLGFHYLGFGFLDAVDKKVYDLMMHLRASGEPNGDIVLVAIDDDSVEKLGRWPWPRSLLARGLDKISEGNPGVVGLSVILSEPEVSDGLREIDALAEEYRNMLRRGESPGEAPEAPAGPADALAALADPASGNQEGDGTAEGNANATGHGNGDGNAERGGDGSAADPVEETDPFLARIIEARSRLDNDAALADALKRAGNVVLPVFFKSSGVAVSSGEAYTPLRRYALGAWDGAPQSWHPRADRITRPIDPFLENAAGLGHINLLFDPEDSTYRREYLYYEYKRLYFPSYTVALAARFLGQERDQTGARPGMGVSVGPLFIPTDPWGATPIDFCGADSTFKSYSFFDVVNDKIPPSVFTDKAVIVTPTAKGIQNPLATPMGTMNVGEFSANALATFLSGKSITEPSFSLLARLVLILFVGLAVTFILPKIRAAAAAGFFAVLLAALAGASAWLFVSKDTWLSTTYPMAMLVIGYIGVVSAQYFVTETTRDKAVGESAETNRMLGVSFQSQGMLDMAFDKFRRVPVDDELKDLLYSLGLDYERKRQFNKAANVYEYIEKHDPKFKDVAQRKTKLMQASDTMVFGTGIFGPTGGDDGLMSTGTDTKPTLGRYEILRQLGKGAMGVVYLGQDPRINRTTAIKTVRFTDEFEEEQAAEMKAKFFREAESAGTLSHPHIVTIYDAGEEQDLA